MFKTQSIVVIFIVLGWVASATAQVRVMHYNIAGYQGDDTAMRAVLAAMHADNKMGWAQPVDIFLFNEVNNTAWPKIIAAVNASAPAGVTYTAGTYTSASGETSASGAQAMFYRSDTLTEIPSGHADIFSGASRYCDRWQMQLKGYTSALSKFYIYGAHLKASTGSTNEEVRRTGMVAIRANADALGAGAICIFTGDFNFYSNAETGYTVLIAAGNSQGIDPYGNGNWTGSSNAWKQTQAPLVVGYNNMVGGGLNDRFDFIVPSLGASDGHGISAMTSTMRVPGNDGIHYNTDINAGNNTYYSPDITRSNILADNLGMASDHIAQLMEFQVPAKMSALLVNAPTRVIKSALASIEVKVQNVAPYFNSTGVEPLLFAVACTGSVLGTASGTGPLSPSSISKFVTLNTSVVGTATGSVNVTSSNEGVETPSISLPVSTQVVRSSNPSLDPTADLDSVTLLLDTQSDLGSVTIDAGVRNHLYDSNQAKLDIDSVSFTGTAASRLSLASGLGAGLTTGTHTLRFELNTVGLTPGPYAAVATVRTSDEDILGAASRNITVNFDIIVGSSIFGDVNGDNMVDAGDISLILLDFGHCEGWCITDLDQSGDVDSGDVALALLSLT
ncbi:MAG: hypothetical protein EXS12_01665 [Phycisphaerales bacterium]|nr:hypothetical protein [Phycisphaerales bacterium]